MSAAPLRDPLTDDLEDWVRDMIAERLTQTARFYADRPEMTFTGAEIATDLGARARDARTRTYQRADPADPARPFS